MGLDIEYIEGQTPLNEEESEGLLIETIATREELDEYEQQNIEEALQWVIGRKFKPSQILNEKFICNLHKRMYKNVWSWAGQFRHSQKNIGITYWKIPIELKKLCDDALYWIENETYPADVIALTFKHRLVSIHCFSNGNGRHSRLMADIIIEKLLGYKIFSWGSSTNLSHESDSRKAYLDALKLADQNSYDSLTQFARS